MYELSEDDFEELVSDEFDKLPDDMLSGLDNVAIFIENLPEGGSMNLLGLYHGVALTHRGQYGFGELPDTISIYRLPLLSIVNNESELRQQVHITLVHEIAHFFGIDDDELHRLGWA